MKGMIDDSSQRESHHLSHLDERVGMSYSARFARWLLESKIGVIVYPVFIIYFKWQLDIKTDGEIEMSTTGEL